MRRSHQGLREIIARPWLLITSLAALGFIGWVAWPSLQARDGFAQYVRQFAPLHGADLQPLVPIPDPAIRSADVDVHPDRYRIAISYRDGHQTVILGLVAPGLESPPPGAVPRWYRDELAYVFSGTIDPHVGPGEHPVITWYERGAQYWIGSTGRFSPVTPLNSLARLQATAQRDLILALIGYLAGFMFFLATASVAMRTLTVSLSSPPDNQAPTPSKL